MNYIYQHQIEILLASNALLVAVVGFTLHRFRQLVQRNEQFWASPVGTQLIEKQDPDAALLGFLDHRLSMLQDNLLRGVAQREISKSEPPAMPKPASMPFDYAARLARQGAGVEDLVQACGLTHAEASLIHRVHGRRQGEGLAA